MSLEVKFSKDGLQLMSKICQISNFEKLKAVHREILTLNTQRITIQLYSNECRSKYRYCCHW